MDNPASVTVVLALGVCVTAWLLARHAPPLPHVSRGKLALVGGWLVLALLLWWSDYPVAWRLPELVEYLAEVTLSAFRILCVTATGAVLFGSMVALLFLSRPKRR
jgi:hypothetical protein